MMIYRAVCVCALWCRLACVNGFIILGHHHHLSQSRGNTMMLTQPTTEDLPIEDNNYSNTIYPTDTLMNIGVGMDTNLAPDIAYFYLQKTLGLSEETMWVRNNIFVKFHVIYHCIVCTKLSLSQYLYNIIHRK